LGLNISAICLMALEDIPMVKKSTYEELQQRIKELEQKAEKFRQVEAALIESEYQAQQYLGLPGVIFLALDKEGNITLINENGSEILGYRREELLGKNWFTTCLPDRFQRDVLEVYHQPIIGEIESTSRYENSILRKDGSERVIAWTNTVLRNSIGEIIGSLSSGEDITERLNSEKQLKNAYDIINESPVVTFLWKNMEGWPVEFVSKNVMTLFGYSDTDFVLGRVSYAAVIHPDDLERVIGEVDSFSHEESRQRFAHEPYRIVTKDGKIKWLDDQTFIRRDETGKITHYQGIVLDITERKLSQKALRESEERYRNLFNNNHSTMLLIDPETADIVDANPAAISYYGWRHEELTGKKITDINILPKERIFQEMERAKKEQRKHFYFRHRLSSGEIRDVEVLSGPIAVYGRKLLYSIIHDITDRKHAEEALLREKNKLQNALEKIKMLSGMLPICANCKKIRDDKGYWNQIESYIREHSEIEFSHGICPKRAKKLYPDLDFNE